MGRTLEEQLEGADPEPWIPEDDGESIFGEIEAVSTREGDFGEYVVVTLVDKNEQVWNVAGFGAVLKGKLAKLTDADVGRKLGVKLLGTKTAKNGKDYKDYRVVLSAAEAAPAVPGDEFPDDDL